MCHPKCFEARKKSELVNKQSRNSILQTYKESMDPLYAKIECLKVDYRIKHKEDPKP